MKSNILTLSVLLALNSANPIYTSHIVGSRDMASTDATAAPTSLTGATPATAQKDSPKIVKDGGNTFIDNGNGDVEAFVGCGTSEGCQKYSLKVNGLEDLKKVQAALEEELKKTKKSVAPKVEIAAFDVAAYEKELRASFESDVLEECEIDVVESNRSSRRSRRNSDDDYEAIDRRYDQFNTSIGSTALAGIQIPRADDRSECAATELQNKLDALLEGFDSELADMGLEDVEIEKIDRILRELKSKIAKEKDPKKKATLEAALLQVENLDKKIIATQKISRDFARKNILRRAENDLASRAGFGFTYLHEMATVTPELFKGIRRDASNSLLAVYKRQAQAHVALKQAANQTQDQNLKLQLTSESIRFGTLATQYNSFMANKLPQTCRVPGQLESCLSPAENLAVGFARDAGINPTGVINDMRTGYLDGASQITSYLTSIAAGNNNAQIPGVLSVDGTTTAVNNGAGQTVQYTGRGRRVLTNGTLQPAGIQQPGIVNQTGVIQRAPLHNTSPGVVNSTVPAMPAGRTVLRH